MADDAAVDVDVEEADFVLATAASPVDDVTFEVHPAAAAAAAAAIAAEEEEAEAEKLLIKSCCCCCW